MQKIPKGRSSCPLRPGGLITAMPEIRVFDLEPTQAMRSAKCIQSYQEFQVAAFTMFEIPSK